MLSGRRRPWGSRRKRGTVRLLLALGAFVTSGCVDVSVTSLVDPGPFSLTFRLDASFHAPHGGQAIEIALVRRSDGVVMASGEGVVSATADPSFVFTTADVLVRGVSYEVHYWIDSNFGGGTAGVCDPKAIDHQWSSEFYFVSNDIAFTTAHQPALTEDVCATFE